MELDLLYSYGESGLYSVISAHSYTFIKDNGKPKEFFEVGFKMTGSLRVNNVVKKWNGEYDFKDWGNVHTNVFISIRPENIKKYIGYDALEAVEAMFKSLESKGYTLINKYDNYVTIRKTIDNIGMNAVRSKSKALHKKFQEVIAPDE